MPFKLFDLIYFRSGSVSELDLQSWFLNCILFELKTGFFLHIWAETWVKEVILFTCLISRTTRKSSHWSAGWCPGASSQSWFYRLRLHPWWGCSRRGCPTWWSPSRWGVFWSSRWSWPRCLSGLGPRQRAWTLNRLRLFFRIDRPGGYTTHRVGISCFWKGEDMLVIRKILHWTIKVGTKNKTN